MSLEMYAARQPIFERDMSLYGYELLYRKSSSNRYEGSNDETSTAGLIESSFLTIGFDELTENKRGFINFSADFLLRDIPSLFPRQSVVVEILERVELTPEVLDACKNLHARGYTLALDDFVFSDEPACRALLDIADIVKIEYPAVSIPEQKRLLSQYGGKIRFLAEKVETREQFEQAYGMGYDLFQGYFFSKPDLISAREIGSLNNGLVQILEELQNTEPSYAVMEHIIEHDLDLTFKLLKMCRSVMVSPREPVRSVRQALARLGLDEIMRWVHLMLLRGIQTTDNAELVKTSLIRGRILELMAAERGKNKSDCFFTGILSSVDVLLHGTMENILKSLPLSGDVKNALLHSDNDMGRCLRAIMAFEQGCFEEADVVFSNKGMTPQQYMNLYLEALRWQQWLPV